MTAYQEQELLINNVLKSLQARHIVSPKRRLEHIKEKPSRHPSFGVRLVRLGYPIVAYRFGNCTFDEGSLRFILLHEEKHVRSSLVWLIPMILFVAVSLQLVLRLLLLALGAEVDILASLLLLAAISCGSILALRHGETQADLWSARKLKSNFGIRTPSEVALRALTWPDEVGGRLGKAIRSLMRSATHPSKEERVARIARDVDADPSGG